MEKYAATVDVFREIKGDLCVFGARIKFAEGYEITKLIEAPNDREYNPNDDAMLIRAYPVLSILLKNGERVFFNGKVTDGLLGHMRIVNEYYHDVYNWNDCCYHLIDIDVKEEVAAKHMPFANDAVMAFSGGVDASHVLLSHKKGLCGKKNLNIKTAIAIGGLEVRINKEEFKSKCDVLKDTLAHFDVELVCMNIPDEEKGFIRYQWNLCACLHLLANTKHYAYGLQGSGSYAYKDINFAADESNPACIEHFSSKAFQLRVEGANIGRTEKCALLATNQKILQNLLVCFDVDFKAVRNCGRCSKCIRTVANFKALGINHVESIRSIDERDFISRLKADVLSSTPLSYCYLLDMANHVRDEEKTKPWCIALYKTLKKRNRKSMVNMIFNFKVFCYRVMNLLSPSSPKKEMIERKIQWHTCAIFDDNVNTLRYFYPAKHRNLAAQMQREKQAAIDSLLK